MTRPYQDVNIFSIQDRRAQAAAKKPWLVRWSVDGRQRSKAFRTRGEADRHRARLLLAAEGGETFDASTGEPRSWAPAAHVPSLYVWARRWLEEQWPEWQPRTRQATAEAIARFVVLAVPSDAPPPPKRARRDLELGLISGATATLPPAVLSWLERWSPPLDSLDRATLAEVDRRLGVGDGGQQLSAWTASRFRKNARACVRRAVELGVLSADPWPKAPQGRSRRKAARLHKRIDARRLPDPTTMAKVLAAIPTQHPASRKYEVMTAVAYYGGLRPSEVVMLRRRSLTLPSEGWGAIDVTEADIDHDVPGEPKTGPRTVPIPPVLVQHLRTWIEGANLSPDALLFRTPKGGLPNHSNWSRALHRALRTVGLEPFRVYDCRHAAATTWLKAGVPLGEAAQRLGHSVDTLVSTYVGVLVGDDVVANGRIDAALTGVVQAASTSGTTG